MAKATVKDVKEAMDAIVKWTQAVRAALDDLDPNTTLKQDKQVFKASAGVGKSC